MECVEPSGTRARASKAIGNSSLCNYCCCYCFFFSPSPSLSASPSALAPLRCLCEQVFVSCLLRNIIVVYFVALFASPPLASNLCVSVCVRVCVCACVWVFWRLINALCYLTLQTAPTHTHTAMSCGLQVCVCLQETLALCIWFIRSNFITILYKLLSELPFKKCMTLCVGHRRPNHIKCLLGKARGGLWRLLGWLKIHHVA